MTFTGSPDASHFTTIYLGRADHPTVSPTAIEHLNLIGDTTETLATAFAMLLNSGYTAVWARPAAAK